MYRDTVWFREEIEVKRAKFLTNCEAGLQRCPALPLWTAVHLLATPLTFPMVDPIQPASLSLHPDTNYTPDEVEDLR